MKNNFINVTPRPSCERSTFYLDVLSQLILDEYKEASFLRNKSYAEIDRYYKQKGHYVILANFHLQYIKDHKC